MKEIWNHNYAYHDWIRKNIPDNSTILDVGCGNGTLSRLLAHDNKMIMGIDTNKFSINVANQNNKYNNVKFIEADFLKYNFKNEKYDVIIFVASIHHMNMEKALIKAKKLLNTHGRIIIVGLAKPSTIIDYIIEILRIIPCFFLSKMKNHQTSEELNIDTCYTVLTMNEIRRICNNILKKYHLRYGLYYRYLLKFEKYD